MSEPLPTWLTGQPDTLSVIPATLPVFSKPAPLDPTPGFEYVGTLPTLPPGLRNVRFIALTPEEINAIRVAARLFAFAGDGNEPITGLSYSKVQPILQDIARRLAPRTMTIRPLKEVPRPDPYRPDTPGDR